MPDDRFGPVLGSPNTGGGVRWWCACRRQQSAAQKILMYQLENSWPCELTLEQESEYLNSGHSSTISELPELESHPVQLSSLPHLNNKLSTLQFVTCCRSV